MARLFGTDGVRGKANTDLTPELAYRLGRAATIYFRKDDSTPTTIFIGKDTRISGHMYESALAAGICSAGGDAVLLDVVPTPAVSYLTHKHGANAGIVISASHNPYYDNGIKFFGGNGYKLPDAIEDEIENIVNQISTNDTLYRAEDDKIGKISYKHELVGEYIDFVVSTTNINLHHMKIVLDCANGASYEVMPEILRRLGADLLVIHNEPNGININDHCGSTHLDSLKEAVIANNADIGIAHDGDADRCLCIDEHGDFIDGDHMIAACAIEMLQKGTLNKNTVVTTVMANMGFHKAIEEAGGKTEITAVGDRYVLENMLENGYNLGGEQSGHIIFTDFSTTGDGPVTAVQVLTYLVHQGKRASDITNIMKTYPQLLINVAVESKDGWDQNKAISQAIQNAEKLLEKNGRILVRASGTESLIRVMAECLDDKLLHRVCDDVVAIVKQELVNKNN